jgi:hypothetical protein
MAIGKVPTYCCLTPCTLAWLTKLFEDLRSLIEVDGYRPSELARALGVDRRKVDRRINGSVRPNAEDALEPVDLITLERFLKSWRTADKLR